MFDQSKLLPTNLPGVFSFPPLPEGVDPNTAPTTTLIRHGMFWRRPTEHGHPAARSAWNRAFGAGVSKRTHSIPHLTPLKKHIARLSNFGAPFNGLCLPNPTWSGAAVRDPWPGWGGVKTVVGTWVLPTVSRPTWPTGNNGRWSSSSWVGLGGYQEGTDSPSPLLQAGFTHDVDQFGTPDSYAWYAFDFTEIRVNNFAMAAGDEVHVSVQFHPVEMMANISLQNLAKQSYQVFAFALDRMHIPGSSVEWIVEVPGVGNKVPQMTPVAFSSAIACNGEVMLANSDRCLTLDGSAGQVNSVTFGSTGDSLTVTQG